MGAGTAKLLELLVIVAAVFGFGFWQLYKLRRERKPGAAKERSAFARRADSADCAEPPSKAADPKSDA